MEQRHEITVEPYIFNGLVYGKTDKVEILTSARVAIGDIILIGEYRPGHYSGDHYEEIWVKGYSTGRQIEGIVTSFSRKKPQTNPQKTIVTVDVSASVGIQRLKE